MLTLFSINLLLFSFVHTLYHNHSKYAHIKYFKYNKVTKHNDINNTTTLYANNCLLKLKKKRLLHILILFEL